MAEIRGFRGWRYNKDKVGNFSNVVAPPYDVISKKEQEAFHKKHPANVIRLILGKEEKKDSRNDNRYTRAKRFLEDWKGSGILIQDGTPSVYVYVQDYNEEGKPKTRLGFIAAMRLDERSVLRHENTLAGPKQDRLALIKEVRTNLSPIFGLFEDPKARTRDLLRQTLKAEPVLDVTVDGVRHRVFAEHRSDILNALSKAMKSRPVFIADGHHRFEVACQFKRLMAEEAKRSNDRSATKTSADQPAEMAGWNYVMMYFSDCVHNPFKIFPTHRLVKFPNGIKTPLAILSKKGKLVRAGSLKMVLSKLEKNRRELSTQTYDIGVYTKKDGFHVLTLDKALVSKAAKDPIRRLDVSVLHEFIIEPCFKIKKIEKSEAIDFTRDAAVAVQKVKSGEFDAAFFLRPTSLKEMIEVSKKGLKMPQKSTYFYPKLLSGLVFHSFEGN